MPGTEYQIPSSSQAFSKALLIYTALCDIAITDPTRDMIADILGDGRVFRIRIEEIDVEEEVSK